MAGRTLTTKLRRDIQRGWLQFVAITVTITLGVALFAASFDAYRNLDASYANLHRQLASADLWVTGGDTRAIASQVRGAAGIAAVETRVQADVPVRIGEDKLRGRIIGVPLRGAQINQQLVLVGDHVEGDRTALVERHLYDHLDLAPGQTVGIFAGERRGWVDVEVTGSAASAEYLWPARSRQELITLPNDFGVLFVPSVLAQRVAGTEPNQVLVRLASDAGADRLAELEQLAATHGATEILTRAEQPSNAALQEDISGLRQMSAAFPILFLTAAGMAAYVLVTRRVQSERTLIGMLMASGVGRGRILRHYLGYGLAAGILGALAGVAAGMAAARAMTRLYLGFIDLPMQAAVFDVRPMTLLGGLGFGLVAGALSAGAPALLASRVEPAEAMRGVVPTSGGRYSLLERLVPPLRRLPTRWRLVLRSIGRNRRRTGSTVVGVTLSLLLILTSWSMIDTMNALIDQQFERVMRQDARVAFAGPQGSGVLDRIRDVDGVAQVEPVVAAPVTLHGPEGRYSSMLTALPQDTDLHGFVTSAGQTTSLASADGMLIGIGARPILGAGPGDLLRVDVPELGITTQVALAGYVDEPLGTFAYASIDRVEAWAGREVPLTSALLGFDQGADRDAVRRAVSELEVVVSYEDSRAVLALYEDLTALFYGFMGAMLVLGGLMAFAIMFTTMSVNIVERSREVATLRASGVRLAQISRLISAENLLMTLLGIVPGLLAGVLGGRVLLRSYSSDLFQLDLVVRPLTLAVATVAIVSVALLSQWPSLRAVRRLDIATAVRERDR